MKSLSKCMAICNASYIIIKMPRRRNVWAYSDEEEEHHMVPDPTVRKRVPQQREHEEHPHEEDGGVSFSEAIQKLMQTEEKEKEKEKQPQLVFPCSDDEFFASDQRNAFNSNSNRLIKTHIQSMVK
jgi:hypothetical protein